MKPTLETSDSRTGVRSMFGEVMVGEFVTIDF